MNYRIEVMVNCDEETLTKIADDINDAVEQHTDCGMQIIDADTGNTVIA